MFKTFLRQAVRNLLRHKVQSLINIGSLAIGLTVFGFAFLYVKQELSYDRGWQDAERVHRLLVELRGLPGTVDQVHDSARSRTWELLADYFGDDMEAATRSAATSVRVPDVTTQYVNLKFVDASFLDVFALEVVEGDLARALAGPGFVAMDEVTAERLGMLGRIGERITFRSFYEQDLEYELVAIFRMPRPVSPATTFPMLTLLHDYSLPLFDMSNGNNVAPWNNGTSVWIKFRPGVATAAFTAKQASFVEQSMNTFNETLGPDRKVSDHVFFRWQPVTDIRFNPMTNEAGFAGDPTRVATLAIVGLLVLLVGCSNSVSLTLAAIFERRREVGVRKAAGAQPGEIMRQQLGEAVLATSIAALPAIAALELLLPPFQALFPVVQLDPGWSDYALLIVIALGVGFACGIYPALVLSATRPQAVLRTGARQGRKGSLGLRNLLVAAQFCFASVLLIATSALYLQLEVARTQPLGFDVNNVIVVFQNGQGSMEPLRLELEKLSGVQQVVHGGSAPPLSNFPLTMNVSNLARDTTTDAVVPVYGLYMGFEFIDFMRIRVLAGRSFDARLDTTNAEAILQQDSSGKPPLRIAVNATAARQLGFVRPEDAVDQIVFQRVRAGPQGAITNGPLQIIGVVEDNL